MRRLSIPEFVAAVTALVLVFAYVNVAAGAEVPAGALGVGSEIHTSQ